MRSSVSYILSSGTSEPSMSHPDYEQYSHDHAALLVLVRHIGSQLKPKTFTKFFDRINKITNVKITDSSGNTRNIIVRYVKEYPVENNDWGDFQTHRRLLGLISLGTYDSQIELNEICRVHESLKVKYTSTIFDSRAILFGPLKDSDSSVDTSPSDSTESDSPKIEKFTTPSNFKTRGLFYDEMGACTDLETQIVEFVNSLFWVLESKRQERSREKLERVSLLLAPFEKKDFVGLDMESRNNKKRSTGRMTKHLGDLCLQAGLLSESLSYYTNSAETLKSVNDWLWLGAAYEGLCAASALVLYPDMQRCVQLQRNASLQEGSSPKKQNTITGNLELKEQRRITPSNVLTPDDISKRYRDAIIHYSKYQNAGIIETEACFKAARIAVEQRHALQAASFLQNIAYINLTISEQERIQRFEMMADLYQQIGFVRKAAFCLRLAATRYVSPQNPSPNWSRCYQLMLQSLPGHRLHLDPNEMLENEQGWPSLQIQLLQEMGVAAKRMGHSALATRHMTFLLQTMWPSLSPNEQKEFAIQLQGLSSQCEGSPVPLVLDNGIVIPPANLINIPICQSFALKNLQPHLQPKKIHKVKQDIGPFLFTPINFGSLERRSSLSNKMTFLWVENELCDVVLKLTNPLPFELKVSDMRLLTSGVVFESIPETVVLPPVGALPTTVTLHGTPREQQGQLQLLGYSTHTLGVKSNCRLRYIENFPPHYEIEIVPSLPVIEIKTSLPPSSQFSSFHDHDENVVTSASLSLYQGESIECTITLTNIGHVDVEMLEINMQTVLEASVEEQMFKWSKENIESQLPLKPSQSASFTLYLYCTGNFLMPLNSAGGNEFSSGVFSSSISGPASLQSRLNSPTSTTTFQRQLNSSFRSSNSGQSSMSMVLPQLATVQPNNFVEGQLRIRYSGGLGLQAQYCRSCSVFFSMETVPSLQVTNWDVLPAETNTQFYLVLDVANLTSQEMELQYTPTKTMLVEGHETIRVPVPVKRCPLSKLDNLETNLERICSEHISNLVDLRWHLLGVNKKGRASLRGITLTTDMLDEVRMSPLKWDVFISANRVRAQEEIICNAGDCLEWRINLTNILDKLLENVTVSMQFYQDYENGTLNYRLDTRLAFAGTNKKLLPLLQPEESAYHECNVIFFHPGLYKLDLRCTAPEFKNGIATVPLTSHLWRFTPPISILVN